MSKAGILFGLMLLLTPLVSVGEEEIKRHDPRLYVAASRANLRTSDYINAPHIAVLRIATLVEVVDLQRNASKLSSLGQPGEVWLEVVVRSGPASGQRGWVHAELLDRIKPSLPLLLARFDSTPELDISARRKWAERAVALSPSSPEARQRMKLVEHHPMLAAIQAGNLSRVKQLLQDGVGVDQDIADYRPWSPREPGMTPLIAALMHGQLEIARHLLERGANPNIQAVVGSLANPKRYVDRYSPLSVAITKHAWDFVDLLILARGVDPDHCATAEDGMLYTPVIMLINQDQLDLAGKLLKKSNFPRLSCQRHPLPEAKAMQLCSNAFQGRDVYKQIIKNWGGAATISDRVKATALWCAIGSSNAGVVSYLLEIGANPNHTDTSGQTPLMRVATWVDSMPLRSDDLRQPTADEDKAIRVRMVRDLLRHGAKPDIRDKQVKSFADHASMAGRQYLLELIGSK